MIRQECATCEHWKLEPYGVCTRVMHGLKCVHDTQAELRPYPFKAPLQPTSTAQKITAVVTANATPPSASDGSTASYYELPPNAKELQDLIAYRDMNAQMGEIFRACYRYGQVAHSPKERDLKKIIFYAQAELDRLARYAK